MGQPAARLSDGISHTPALLGFIAGAAIVAATITTGGAGLAAIAIAAGEISGGALLGEMVAGLISVPTGSILETGSPNVFINGLPAARALLDACLCAFHPLGPPKPIAEGAERVLINGMPAARQSSHIACGAQISAGSPNVFIGGPTATAMAVEPEVPEWLNTAATVISFIGMGAGLSAGMSALSGAQSFADC